MGRPGSARARAQAGLAGGPARASRRGGLGGWPPRPASDAVAAWGVTSPASGLPGGRVAGSDSPAGRREGTGRRRDRGLRHGLLGWRPSWRARGRLSASSIGAGLLRRRRCATRRAAPSPHLAYGAGAHLRLRLHILRADAGWIQVREVGGRRELQQGRMGGGRGQPREMASAGRDVLDRREEAPLLLRRLLPRRGAGRRARSTRTG
jgi:hypothetical protein